MTPIPWTTLTAEEKKEVFWKSMGVEPTLFSCGDCDSCRTEQPQDCIFATELEFEPLTLDALFALAKERKVDFYIEGNSVAWKVVIFGGEPIIIFADNPIDCMTLALLRFRGINVEEK